MVPASWKLCVLVLKAIAEGYLPKLEKKLSLELPADIISYSKIEKETFSDRLRNLYIELCKEISNELPTEIYSCDSPKEELERLRDTAYEILKWYDKASPHIEWACDYSKYFNLITDNCKIIIKLIECKPDKSSYKEEWDIKEAIENCWYFSHLYMRPLHRILNGVCIKDISYDDFYHILECNGICNWIQDDNKSDLNGVTVNPSIDEDGNSIYIAEKDYSELKITPIEGYGMTMYAFLLLLLVKRQIHEYPFSDWDDNGEWNYVGFDTDDELLWANKFKNRIAWDDYYNIREDSWKEGYCDNRIHLSSICEEVMDICKEDKDLMRIICQRYAFDDIVCPDAMALIVDGYNPSTLKFEQYKYIRDNYNNLEKIGYLLIQEIEFLYRHYVDIAECFYNKTKAENLRDNFSKTQFEIRQKTDEAISKLYNKQLKSIKDYLPINRLLMPLRYYSYGYLWQQPLICSEMVKDYLQKCILQDETLLLVIKRYLDDATVQRSLSNNVSGSKLRNEEAIRILREKKIIDEQNNIQQKIKNSKKVDKCYFKTRELIRFLVSGEYVKPIDGWRDHIASIKQSKIPLCIINQDGTFSNEFYYKNLDEYVVFFVNGIDWAPFKEKFILNGKTLKEKELSYFLKNKREFASEIMRPILKEYDSPFCV